MTFVKYHYGANRSELKQLLYAKDRVSKQLSAYRNKIQLLEIAKLEIESKIKLSEETVN